MTTRKGFDTGPDLTKWIAGIVTVGITALLVSGACLAGIEDSPDPYKSARISGTITVQQPSGRSVTLGGVTFTNMASTSNACQSDADCGPACEADLSNPYCFVVNARCITWGTGTACSCVTFCARDGGGIQHEPGELFKYMQPIEQTSN